MAELDMKRFRELAGELGYWPATTEPDDFERHRRLNPLWIVHRPPSGSGASSRT